MKLMMRNDLPLIASTSSHAIANALLGAAFLFVPIVNSIKFIAR
jgi:hypothetical protein